MINQVVTYRGNVKKYTDLNSKDLKKQNGDIYHVIGEGNQYIYIEDRWVSIHDLVYKEGISYV